MSYDYRIPQGRDKGKRTNGMFSLGGKLGSVLSALGNGEKLMQVRLWQNWEMVMGPMPPGTGVMAEARGATCS